MVLSALKREVRIAWRRGISIVTAPKARTSTLLHPSRTGSSTFERLPHYANGHTTPVTSPTRFQKYSPLAFTAHMNDANVSTSLTLCSRKCFSTTNASVLCTSVTSDKTGVTLGRLSSSNKRELRLRLALALSSRRGRLAGVGGRGCGPGLAVEVLCPRPRSRNEGGGGSKAVVAIGSMSGTMSN